jgi:hypothetical protein
MRLPAFPEHLAGVGIADDDLARLGRGVHSGNGRHGAILPVLAGC